MQLWNNFAAKHPAAAKWVREGGLFVIVSNLVTVFKYLLLQFLPAAFSSLPVVDFGWPGIPVTLFGETFRPRSRSPRPTHGPRLSGNYSISPRQPVPGHPSSPG